MMDTATLTESDKRLIHHYLDPEISLFDLCEMHRLKLPEIVEFLEREDVAKAIEALASLCATRASHLKQCHADRAASALVSILDDATASPETRRRAAAALSPSVSVSTSTAWSPTSTRDGRGATTATSPITSTGRSAPTM